MTEGKRELSSGRGFIWVFFLSLPFNHNKQGLIQFYVWARVERKRQIESKASAALVFSQAASS